MRENWFGGLSVLLAGIAVAVGLIVAAGNLALRMRYTAVSVGDQVVVVDERTGGGRTVGGGANVRAAETARRISSRTSPPTAAFWRASAPRPRRAARLRRRRPTPTTTSAAGGARSASRARPRPRRRRPQDLLPR